MGRVSDRRVAEETERGGKIKHFLPLSPCIDQQSISIFFMLVHLLDYNLHNLSTLLQFHRPL